MVLQRLAGAPLLVFANKQDLPGSMTQSEISQVRFQLLLSTLLRCTTLAMLTTLLDTFSFTRLWTSLRSNRITGRSGPAVLSQDRTSYLALTGWSTMLLEDCITVLLQSSLP